MMDKICIPKQGIRIFFDDNKMGYHLTPEQIMFGLNELLRNHSAGSIIADENRRLREKIKYQDEVIEQRNNMITNMKEHPIGDNHKDHLRLLPVSAGEVSQVELKLKFRSLEKL